MIAANKRLLKATLTQGVLGIQISLIQLYTANLNSVNVEAAVIAGFAFSALKESHRFGSLKDYILVYIYYVSFAISFIAAIFVVTQVCSTIFMSQNSFEMVSYHRELLSACSVLLLP